MKIRRCEAMKNPTKILVTKVDVIKKKLLKKEIHDEGNGETDK